MDKDRILSKMTREEKISYCTGKDFWCTKNIERLGIESIMVSDGPHGVRCQKGFGDMVGVNFSLPSTCFPPSVTSGSTWDRDLLKREGEAIGEEARHYGVSVVLGPGCNIKRNPLGGRNFEYFSEDPVVSGEMGGSWIQGVESTGVGTSLKHFAANNQEYKRFISDSIMDERTMREIYLSSFERAIKKGNPGTVMCSYNKINGVYSSDNKKLLTDILRKEWGWDGVVMTDWGAMNDRIEAFKAGCDLNMPGGSDYMDKEVLSAIENGTLDEKNLDKSVMRILSLVEKYKVQGEYGVDWESHHNLAREIAEKGAVLLKNEDSILPLHESDDIVYFGYLGFIMRYQGSGSSHINAKKVTNPMDVISSDYYYPSTDEKGNISEKELDRAEKEAKKHNKAVIFAGLPDSYESETFDRENMNLPQGYIDLIERVSSVNPNTVVVLFGGSAIDISWEKGVKGILYMGLPGEAGGEAVKRLLFGLSNPSGKLTQTWPEKYEDYPSLETWGKVNAEYREGIYVGYRYFDKAGIKPCRPFGFGLSYTSFQYSDLRIDGRVVSFSIKNVGERKGAEVVQLYIENPNEGIYRCKRELRDFERVELDKGEEKRVSFTLNDRDFSVFDGEWKTIGGSYIVEIGSSSRDIRLSKEIEVKGEELSMEVRQEGTWYTLLEGKCQEKDYQKLLGRPVLPYVPHKKGEYTMNDSCMDMKDKSLIMKIQYEVTKNIVAKPYQGKKDMNDPGFKMMVICSTDCPLRSSVINSGGTLSHKMGKAFLEMANGRWIKGIKILIKG